MMHLFIWGKKRGMGSSERLTCCLIVEASLNFALDLFLKKTNIPQEPRFVSLVHLELIAPILSGFNPPHI